MRRYEAARDDVARQLTILESELSPAQRALVETARERLSRARFVLAVVGEFSSGKSFLLNALLGKFRLETVAGAQRVTGLLATDINPSTATITELQYGSPEEAHAYYEDGRSERIPLDRLSKFVAVAASDEGKRHDATGEEGGAPSRVLVTVDSAFLQRGFTVADTPGLASINPLHRRATLQFLPSADAVLYLIDTQQPFSEGDAVFLGIIRQHIDSIFIVQTKIDLWNQQQADSREVWESAHDRIASLAAIHAPGTYVYALSARLYAEGMLKDSAELVDRSRFGRFLDALDASLIATTGRARLVRALQQTELAVNAASAQYQRNAEMLALSEAELERRHNAAVPALAAQDEQAAAQRAVVLERAAERRALAAEQGEILAEEVQTAFTQAFDTADIVRLRDRARLHILVDRVFAAVIGEFAEEIAAQTIEDLRGLSDRARNVLPFEFSMNDAAALAFGGQPGTGMWTAEPAPAIAATIVLEAIGGPAIALVADIAERFAAAKTDAYMKRELTADLRAEIFPRLSREVEAFTQRVAERFQAMYDALAGALETATATRRENELGSIELARKVRASGANPAETLAQYQRSADEIRARLGAVRQTVEAFLQHEPEIMPADPGHEAVRRSHEIPFDSAAYGLGLRPQRWRVAVLGALRRGKSSLINAIAGSRVLADETAGTIAFPVHVRYGPAERAYALQHDGTWGEVQFTTALEEATRNPVLIETPWNLPRELVLVHVPAFDTGEEHQQEIAIVAASQASEVLCLFSRQLSDRELDMYQRIAELDKPMLFVHTIADNETASERRQVVELAETYLAERSIVPKRVFTISTMDYAKAKREARAPSAWNELDALASTLTADAESHMERLARLERAASMPATPPPADRKDGPGLGRTLARLFGKSSR